MKLNHRKLKPLLRRLAAFVLCCAMLCSFTATAFAEDLSVAEQKKALDKIWKTESYSLIGMTNEDWFKAFSLTADAYHIFSKLGNWRIPHGKQAYMDTMVDLIYPDDNTIDKLFENASTAKSVIKVTNSIVKYLPLTTQKTEKKHFGIEVSQTLFDNRKQATEALGDLLNEANQIFFLSENVWKLVKLSVGSDEVSRAIKLLGDQNYGTECDAARELAKNQAEIRSGSAGTAVLQELLKEENIGNISWDILSEAEVFSLWKKAVKGTTFVLDHAFHTGQYTDTITEYENLAYIQAQLENTLNVTKLSNYDSEEEFIEDYRALAYTYVLCAYRANALFADWSNVDQELWEEVRTTFQDSLSEILAVGVSEETQSTATDFVQEASKLQITQYDAPAHLQHQDTFVCYGTVSTTDGSALSPVAVQVLDQNGTAVIDVSSGDLGTASCYDILALDSQITLNHLQPGNYRYLVQSGGQVLLDQAFTIESENQHFTIVGYRLPHPMAQGSVFSVTGTVRASEKMSKVEVGIYDTNNNWVTGDTAYPYSTEYSLSALDRNTRFDWLSSGQNYSYRITAVNESGETEILVDQPFYIY